METEDKAMLAEQVANQIIDKTYWGNEWFFFFNFLLIVLLTAAGTVIAAYLTTRAQNKAFRVDFGKALDNLKKQTEAVKSIEESISHGFIELREKKAFQVLKIEESYIELQVEYDYLVKAFDSVIKRKSDYISKNVQNKANMLLSLNFNRDFHVLIQDYTNKRSDCFKKLVTLYYGEAEKSINKDDYSKELSDLLKTKSKLEHALQLKMNSIYP